MYPTHSVGKAVMKRSGICAEKQICLLGVDQLSTACHGLIIGRTGGVILNIHLGISNSFTPVE